MHPESGRIVYVPDPTSRIRFSSVLPKKTWIILRNTDPDPIWMAWSGFGQTHLVWNSWCAGIIGPCFWQDATGPLPVSRFPTRFSFSTDVPDHIAQNQPGSDLALADCVRFWPNGSGPEASQCARIGSGMFTGLHSVCLQSAVIRVAGLVLYLSYI